MSFRFFEPVFYNRFSERYHSAPTALAALGTLAYTTAKRLSSGYRYLQQKNLPKSKNMPRGSLKKYKRTSAADLTSRVRRQYRTGAISKSRAIVKAVANSRTSGFTGIEKKFLDVTRTSAAMTNTWTQHAPDAGSTNCISAPVQGAGNQQRVGRTYQIMSVFVRFIISIPSDESVTLPLSNVIYRVCVVLDMQTNSTALTATDVMLATTVSDVLSFRNLEDTARFVVLYDSGPRRMVRDVSNEGAINLFAAPLTEHVLHFYKAFKLPIKVRSSGTTANVTSAADNSISVIAITQDTNMNMQYNSRIRFVD